MSRRGKHGKYPIWVCPTCGFGVSANHWRQHRCLCARVAHGTRCSFCRDFFPCRKRGCPKVEAKPVEIADEVPGEAPRAGVVRSLGMRVTRLPDGRWSIRAAWLDGSVVAATWPEAYWAAVRAR